jgi:hypothetical protein
MPRIRCVCGAFINLTRLPCAEGFKVISEEAADAMVDRLMAAREVSAAEFENIVHGIFRGSMQGYECTGCGRWRFRSELPTRT